MDHGGTIIFVGTSASRFKSKTFKDLAIISLASN
jgi:hypothetical protein